MLRRQYARGHIVAKRLYPCFEEHCVQWRVPPTSWKGGLCPPVNMLIGTVPCPSPYASLPRPSPLSFEREFTTLPHPKQPDTPSSPRRPFAPAGVAVIISSVIPEWHGSAAGVRTLALVHLLRKLG